MLKASLVSTYEGGMQPLGLATAAAHLIAAGHEVTAHDAFLEPPVLEQLAASDLVAFSLPLFESLDAAVTLCRELRATESRARVVFYGTYAMLNKERFISDGAAGVILGDWEQTLVDVAERVEAGVELEGIDGLFTGLADSSPRYTRQAHRLPNRSILPPLTRYSYAEAVQRVDPKVVVGNVETARGCRFSCSYCSVFAANPQKVTVFAEDIVLADIEQVVGLGATHICFVDAEFLNAPAHALKIVRQMHQRFPRLTFDFTSRADLVADDPGRIDELVACGARFVTTAFEFPKQQVLDAINKQFTVETLRRALSVCRTAGLGINPTFVLFNPWIGLQDLQAFTDFLVANGLEQDVATVQLQTRLWLYKGSPLVSTSDVSRNIVAEQPFNYEWRHADPDVERVFMLAVDQPTEPGVAKRCCLKC